jgi:hypothetical protein
MAKQPSNSTQKGYPKEFFQYLYHSYRYYKLDDPVISDAEYDKLCKFLKAHWDDVKHPCKGLITEEDLSAGTGFAIKYSASLEWYIKDCIQGDSRRSSKESGGSEQPK